MAACGGRSDPAAAQAVTAQVIAPVQSPASEPAAASAPASAPMPASTPIVKIVVYGDDQTLGRPMNQFGMTSVVTPNEPVALQALLQKQFNDTGIQVINASTGGRASSLANELDGMDGGGSAEPQRMQQSGASIAIQAHALNDQYSSETPAEYAAYLGQWIQDAQTAGLTPVLEQPSPTCDGDHPRLADYAAAMDSVGKQYNVPVIRQYDFADDLPGWQAHMLGGCVIPDAIIDATKAARAEAVVAPLAAKLIRQ